jgi:hypothetical protein
LTVGVFVTGILAMIVLELDHSSERRLAEEAGKLGLTPERYAVLLLHEAMMARADPTRPPIVPSSEKAAEEWERELDELIEDQDHSIPAIPDEALRRENLYQDWS